MDRNSDAFSTSPEKCNAKIYEEGRAIFVADARAKVAEAWCEQLRKQTKVKEIDWHYVAGRVIIKTLPEHIQFFQQAGIEMLKQGNPFDGISLYDTENECFASLPKDCKACKDSLETLKLSDK